MMAKKRGDRFQTPREVADAVAPFAAAPVDATSVDEPGPAGAILPEAQVDAGQVGTVSWSTGHTGHSLTRATPPPLPRRSRVRFVAGLCVGGLAVVLMPVLVTSWLSSTTSPNKENPSSTDKPILVAQPVPEDQPAPTDKPALADKKAITERPGAAPAALAKLTTGRATPYQGSQGPHGHHLRPGVFR